MMADNDQPYRFDRCSEDLESGKWTERTRKLKIKPYSVSGLIAYPSPSFLAVEYHLSSSQHYY